MRTEMTEARRRQRRRAIGVALAAGAVVSACGLLGVNIAFVGLVFARCLRYLFGGVGSWIWTAALGWAAFSCLVKREGMKLTAGAAGVLCAAVFGLSLCHHLAAPPGEEFLPDRLVNGGGCVGGAALFAARKIAGAGGGLVLLLAGFLGACFWTVKRYLPSGTGTAGRARGTRADADGSAAVSLEARRAQRRAAEEERRANEAEARRQAEEAARAAAEPPAAKPEGPLSPRKALYDQTLDAHFTAASAAGAPSVPKEPPPVPPREAPPRRAAPVLPARGPLPAARSASAPRAAGGYLERLRRRAAGAAVTPVRRAPSVTADAAASVSRVPAAFDDAAARREETAASASSAGSIGLVRAAESAAGGLPEVPVDAMRGQTAAAAAPAEPEAKKTEPRRGAPSAAFSAQASASASCARPSVSGEAQGMDTMHTMHIAGVFGAPPFSLAGGRAAEPDAPPEGAEAREALARAMERALAAGVVSDMAHGAEERGARDEEDAPPAYRMPQVSAILEKRPHERDAAVEQEMEENAKILAQTLADFRVKAEIINACHGPAVTRYELKPAPGVKVSKIENLADDLALALAAFSVRIEPVPGKAAIGVEVPNRRLEGVTLRDVLESEAFANASSRLTAGLGIDIGGQAILADLGEMPHLLIAGATGSGKSVCVNTLITSVLFKARPDEVKFIMIDPKMVELSNYNGIPHLMVPVVTDSKKAASVLNWAVQEMEKRYARFASLGVRKMADYNSAAPGEAMPAIVIIIDELADLMMVAPRDVEEAIFRLAQKARAAGIHLVLATQRPSVDVITGTIKTNIPSRISFAVSSQIDSRTILDTGGAEKLLGKGDMLYYPIGAAKPIRVQGAFISDEEIERLLSFIRAQGEAPEPDEEILRFTEQAEEEDEKEAKGKKAVAEPARDELLEKAVELVLTNGQASASSIQRRFRIGYTRAARLIDTMEELRIIGPNIGSKPREIRMTREEAAEAIRAAGA